MSIKLDREQLIKALSICAPAIEKRDIAAFLKYVLIEPASKNKMVFHAGNADIYIRTTIPLNPEDHSNLKRCCVPFRFLSGLSSKLHSQNVILNFASDRMEVRSGGHKSSSATIQPEEFPALPPIPAHHSVTVSETFWEKTKLVLPFITPDQSRPPMAAIYVKFKQGKAIITSTNGNVVGRVICKVGTVKKDFSILIPGRVVEAILNVGKGMKSQISLAKKKNAGTIRFDGGPDITFLLPVGEFPNTAKVIREIEREIESTLIVRRQVLVDTIERLDFIASCHESQAGNRVTMQMGKEKDRIQLDADLPTVEGKEVIKCTGKQKKRTCIISSVPMLAALREPKDNKLVKVMITPERAITIINKPLRTLISLQAR